MSLTVDVAVLAFLVVILRIEQVVYLLPYEVDALEIDS